MLFMKAEDLKANLSDLCARCKSPTPLQDEWHEDVLYKVGTCACGYKNHCFVKRA